ncbi:stomatin-like protein 2, mitochondrial isoform X2 [Amphibalanus amphitrite]|uniref:stomatin-like protein 2, mitochondrial isoform X2 n=2 Tax=Amphibalanus amphitrite TaxID=1232801 RepID=UPI001C8FB979|nr:stomatin-like protein 2, mitochondrial isoform X2 [Amphibalanus amphitrite]
MSFGRGGIKSVPETDLYPSLLPVGSRSDSDRPWYGELAQYTTPAPARPWYPEPPPLDTLPSRAAMADPEPIYMSPSEVAQGHKHAARGDDADSVISDASLSTLAEEPGQTSLSDARYNQLKRTHQLREKLREWEPSADGAGQDSQLMVSAESGVFIEELHEFDGPNRPADQRGSSLLKPGEMSVALDSPAGRARVSQVRLRHSTPMNTVIMFVPQQEAWVVERMGKYSHVMEPGLNLLLPVVDRVKYVQNMKEQAIDIPQQSAITSDNVTLAIDGVLFLRVVDPYKASYGVEDPEFAITQLAQTTMRSELGKIQLDNVFRERESLNIAIVESINKASECWGITCLRYEIRDIKLPQNVQEAMQMQAQAERKKRAAILESEGVRTAEINVAEGQKQSVILASEAARMELVNKAEGEAEALLSVARARAQSLAVISEALSLPNGQNAASLAIAEQYVRAFQSLAKENNTMLLPADTGNMASMVSQAMAIYGNVTAQKQKPAIGGSTDGPAGGSTSGAPAGSVTGSDVTSGMS